MYIPKHFEIVDEAVINKFIQENSFGQLISMQDGAITATHMPFLFQEEENSLIGHLAIANPQWRQIQDQQVLVTLQGDHGYVSPSWYKSAGVPTWNYQAVHIVGTANNFTDPEKLKQVVDTLTTENESGNANHWQPDYATSMLRGIIGIEIRISSIQCKFKLSQNRSEADRISVREQLGAGGHEALADAM